MLFQYDLKLDKMVSAYSLILLNYIFLIISLIRISRYTFVGLFFYLPSYLLITGYNHLTYFAKIESYPNDEIRKIMPRNKGAGYFLYIVLLIPFVFPEVIVIRSIAFVLYMFETKGIIVINIIRLMFILSFIGWMFIVNRIIDWLVIGLTLMLFTTLGYYRYYVIRKIWYIIGIFIPFTIIGTFTCISGILNKIFGIKYNNINDVHQHDDISSRIHFDQRSQRDIIIDLNNFNQIIRRERLSVLSNERKDIINEILLNCQKNFDVNEILKEENKNGSELQKE